MKTPLPVAASIAQRPGFGGHAWAFLQYALGFEELGYDPILIDRLSADMVAGPDGRPSVAARARAESWFREVTAWAGLSERSALLLDDGSTIGLERSRLKELVAAAPFLLDVMGFLDDPELTEAARIRVFLDVDPGFTQIWQDNGEADLFGSHDRHLTVGANIGSPGCSIPTCGRTWIPIRPPVALSRCAAAPIEANAFRTVASWRGPFDPVQLGSERLGLRVHEFRKFVGLPGQVGARFEIALEIDPADEADVQLLRGGGWDLLDPRSAAGSPASYEEFIRASGAEISIAKNVYVDTRSGWFSDRSACFLAAGRPVLAQDTGLGEDLLASDGLFAFSTLDEAIDSAREIEASLGRFGEAARSLAEDVFDSRKILSGMLREIDAG